MNCIIVTRLGGCTTRENLFAGRINHPFKVSNCLSESRFNRLFDEFERSSAFGVGQIFHRRVAVGQGLPTRRGQQLYFAVIQFAFRALVETSHFRIQVVTILTHHCGQAFLIVGQAITISIQIVVGHTLHVVICTRARRIRILRVGHRDTIQNVGEIIRGLGYSTQDFAEDAIAHVNSRSATEGRSLTIGIFPSIAHTIAIGIRIVRVATTTSDVTATFRDGVTILILRVAFLTVPKTVEVRIRIPGVSRSRLIRPTRERTIGIFLSTGQTVTIQVARTVCSAVACGRIGVEVHIESPTIRHTVAIGIGIRRIQGVATEQARVVFFTRGEGSRIDSLERRCGASGETKGTIDVKVTQDAVLGIHFQEDRGFIFPYDVILFLSLSKLHFSRLIFALAFSHVSNDIFVEETNHVVFNVIVSRLRFGGVLPFCALFGQGHLEEVVIVRIEAHFCTSEEVVVGVHFRVICAIVGDVARIEIVLHFPTIRNPVIIGIAIQGIGANGEFFQVGQAVVIGIGSDCGGCEGIKCGHHIFNRDRFPVVTLTTGSLTGIGGKVFIIVGIFRCVRIVTRTETATHHELISGGIAAIGVHVLTLAHINCGPKCRVDLHAHDFVLVISILFGCHEDRGVSDTRSIVPEVVVSGILDAIAIGVIICGTETIQPRGQARINVLVSVRLVREGFVQEDTCHSARIDEAVGAFITLTSVSIHALASHCVVRFVLGSEREECACFAICFKAAILVDAPLIIGITEGFVIVAVLIGANHDVVCLVSTSTSLDRIAMNVNHIGPAIHHRGSIIRDLVVIREGDLHAISGAGLIQQTNLIPSGGEDTIVHRTSANDSFFRVAFANRFFRVNQNDPCRVREPVAITVSGVQGVIATADTHLVTEGACSARHCARRHICRRQAINAICIAQLVSSIARTETCVGEIFCFSGRTISHRAAFNQGCASIGTHVTEQPTIRHAVLVVVAEFVEVRLFAVLSTRRERVTGEIFSHEDCGELDILPLARIGCFAILHVSTIEGEDIFITTIFFRSTGRQDGFEVAVSRPLIEEGVERLGEARVTCERSSIARIFGEVVCREGISGHRHEGVATILREGVRGVGRTEGPVRQHVRTIIPKDVTRTRARLIVNGIEDEVLGGLERQATRGGRLAHRRVGHREEPFRSRTRGIGVGEGVGLAIQDAINDRQRLVRARTVELLELSHRCIPSGLTHHCDHRGFIRHEDAFLSTITIGHRKDEVIALGIGHGEGEGNSRTRCGVHATRSALDHRSTVGHHREDRCAFVKETRDFTSRVAGLGHEERTRQLHRGGGVCHIHFAHQETRGLRIVVAANHIEVHRGFACGHGHAQFSSSRRQCAATLSLKRSIACDQIVSIDGVTISIGNIGHRGILINAMGVSFIGRVDDEVTSIISGRDREGVFQNREVASSGTFSGILRLVGFHTHRTGRLARHDGDAFTLRRGRDGDVEGLFGSAHAIGAFQSGHANAIVGGRDRIGIADGELHLVGAISRNRHVVTFECGVGFVISRNQFDRCVERAVVDQSICAILLNNEGDGLPCPEGERTAFNSSIRQIGVSCLQALIRERDGALGHVGIRHGVASRCGRHRGIFHRVSSISIGGRANSIVTTHTVAEANGLTSQGSGHADHELLARKGGIVHARDLCGERFRERGGRGGVVVTFLNSDAFGGHRGDTHVVVLITSGIFHPEVTLRVERGGGQYRTRGSITDGGHRHRHQTCIEDTGVIVVSITHGQGVAAHRNRSARICHRNVLALHHHIAQVHAARERTGGGVNRRQLHALEVAAECRSAFCRGGPRHVGAHITGTNHIGEAQRIGRSTRTHIVCHCSSGLFRRRCFGASRQLRRGALKRHIQQQIRTCSAGDVKSVAGEFPLGRQVLQLHIEVDLCRNRNLGVCGEPLRNRFNTHIIIEVRCLGCGCCP